MSDCRFGVSPVNYPDPDPDPDFQKKHDTGAGGGVRGVMPKSLPVLSTEPVLR